MAVVFQISTSTSRYRWAVLLAGAIALFLATGSGGNDPGAPECETDCPCESTERVAERAEADQHDEDPCSESDAPCSDDCEDCGCCAGHAPTAVTAKPPAAATTIAARRIDAPARDRAPPGRLGRIFRPPKSTLG